MDSKSNFTILHLEDDHSLREAVKDLLEIVMPDVVVHHFDNADDAINFITSNGNEVDLYLLDVRVPGSTDGIGVARHVRSRRHSGMIVFMSAYQKPDSSVLNEDLKYQWLNKPSPIESLVTMLERARQR